MNLTSPAVIKKHLVRMLETPRVIGAASGQAGSGPAACARIVRRSEAGVLVEVTCACGEKTYLQCDYARAAETA